MCDAVLTLFRRTDVHPYLGTAVGRGGKSRVDFGGSADDPSEARGNVCAYGMVVFRGKAAKY